MEISKYLSNFNDKNDSLLVDTIKYVMDLSNNISKEDKKIKRKN